MGKNSKIGWTDHTWNPWVGCTKVSPGCDNCYMYRFFNRIGRNPAELQKTKHKTFFAPLAWKEPSRIFVCSWSDFYHPDADRWREDAFNVMSFAQQHIYLILTKRPERIIDNTPVWALYSKNIWFGVTVENASQDWRVITLDDFVPMGKRFVSIEPIIGPVLLDTYLHKGKIDWIICGGESGPGARPPHPFWVEEVRDGCRVSEIPFYFKQWGEFDEGSEYAEHQGKNYIVLSNGDYANWDTDDWKKLVGKYSPKQWRDLSPVVCCRVGVAKAGNEINGQKYEQIPVTMLNWLGRTPA